MKFLIVCAGNTCRSPMAAGLLIHKSLNSKGVEVRSAGVDAWPGSRLADNAIAVMEEIGIDIKQDFPKQVTQELIEWADYVVPLSSKYDERLVEDFPVSAFKVLNIHPEIQDPVGQPIEVYRNCRDSLSEVMDELLQAVHLEI